MKINRKSIKINKNIYELSKINRTISVPGSICKGASADIA